MTLAPEIGEAAAEMVIEDERWIAQDGLIARCEAALAAAHARLEAPRPGAAAVLLADDALVHDLNLRFRGKNRPTNVLSFPAPETERYPGDIALAYETCAREAAEKDVALADHAAHLAVHGLLHLNGFDHQNDAEAEAMEALETAILADIGLADPYQPK